MHACICIMYIPGNLKAQKKTSDPWKWNYSWLGATI